MAQILCNLREEALQSELENGVAGVGGLQTRELGYSSLSLEFSFRTHAGPIIHIPTREKLALAAAAATSGAKGIGYFPSGSLVSEDVQAALDELASSVAGVGSLSGTGPAGAIALWSSGLALGGSILSQVSSAIRFQGDAVANLYRGGAGILRTDGNFDAIGNVSGNTLQSLGGGAEITGGLIAYDESTLGYSLALDDAAVDGSWVAGILGSITKDNSNVRAFSILSLYPILATGASNLNTVVTVLDIDTVNTSLTGLNVNLLRLAFGGSDRITANSAGDLYSVGSIVSRDLVANRRVVAGLTHILNVDESVWPFGASSSLTKNNSDVREYSIGAFTATLNAGASNLNTTVNLIYGNTTNTGLTGVDVNLMRLLYGNSERWRVDSSGNLYIQGDQILTTRRTGWGAWTGTATRSAIATGSATLQNVAEGLKALLDDLASHGIIGT